MLPLYIPVLIFGVSAVDAALFGLGAGPRLLILGGLSLFALALAPVRGGGGVAPGVGMIRFG